MERLKRMGLIVRPVVGQEVLVGMAVGWKVGMAAFVEEVIE